MPHQKRKEKRAVPSAVAESSSTAFRRTHAAAAHAGHHPYGAGGYHHMASYHHHNAHHHHQAAAAQHHQMMNGGYHHNPHYHSKHLHHGVSHQQHQQMPFHPHEWHQSASASDYVNDHQQPNPPSSSHRNTAFTSIQRQQNHHHHHHPVEPEPTSTVPLPPPVAAPPASADNSVSMLPRKRDFPERSIREELAAPTEEVVAASVLLMAANSSASCPAPAPSPRPPVLRQDSSTSNGPLKKRKKHLDVLRQNGGLTPDGSISSSNQGNNGHVGIGSWGATSQVSPATSNASSTDTPSSHHPNGRAPAPVRTTVSTSAATQQQQAAMAHSSSSVDSYYALASASAPPQPLTEASKIGDTNEIGAASAAKSRSSPTRATTDTTTIVPSTATRDVQSRASSVVPNFPILLHSILTSVDGSSSQDSLIPANVLQWTESKQSWKIIRWDALRWQVLPKYFPSMELENGMGSVDAFLYNLLAWGFEEVADGPDVGAFRHPLFVKEKPKLCEDMKASPLGWSSKNLSPRKEHLLRVPSLAAACDERSSNNPSPSHGWYNHPHNASSGSIVAEFRQPTSEKSVVQPTLSSLSATSIQQRQQDGQAWRDETDERSQHQAPHQVLDDGVTTEKLQPSPMSKPSSPSNTGATSAHDDQNHKVTPYNNGGEERGVSIPTQHPAPSPPSCSSNQESTSSEGQQQHGGRSPSSFITRSSPIPLVCSNRGGRRGGGVGGATQFVRNRNARIPSPPTMLTVSQRGKGRGGPVRRASPMMMGGGGGQRAQTAAVGATSNSKVSENEVGSVASSKETITTSNHANRKTKMTLPLARSRASPVNVSATKV